MKYLLLLFLGIGLTQPAFALEEFRSLTLADQNELAKQLVKSLATCSQKKDEIRILEISNLLNKTSESIDKEAFAKLITENLAAARIEVKDGAKFQLELQIGSSTSEAPNGLYHCTYQLSLVLKAKDKILCQQRIELLKSSAIHEVEKTVSK